mgnify:CR=1 FL=1
MSEQKELHRGDRISDTFPCIADEVEGKNPCGSSDGMSVYVHAATEDKEEYYDASCWVCKQGFGARAFANSSVGESFLSGDERERELRKSRPKKRLVARERNELLAKCLSYKSVDNPSERLYRGLKAQYLAYFAHLLEYNEDKELVKVYYPETQSNKLYGYKPRRTQDKDFVNPIGWTGSDSDLSGASKFKAGGKYLAIVGGENDKVALFQVLRDKQLAQGREGFDPVAVVSPTTGEGSAASQCAKNYDFIDSFDVIKVGLDNDEAGLRATEELLKVLPHDKVEVITWSMEDPHAMLEARKEAQILSNFYNAKPLRKGTIKKSSEINSNGEVIAELLTPRIPLPPQLRRVQDNMGGGIKQGRMMNIIGTTSSGKTTAVNNLVYYWLFNSPVKVGVVSVELTAAQYAIEMLSIHSGKNLEAMPPTEAVEWLESDEGKACEADLWVDEYGEERFVIIDEREGGIPNLEKQMDIAIKKHGCQVLVIDVLSDLTREAPLDQQEGHMMYQKRLLKEGITPINILHTKKIYPDNKGVVRRTNQYDSLGTGSFVQSAAINLVINRNLMSEDNMERNTTEFDMPKCRGGVTGEAISKVYYDRETRKTYDLQDYLLAQGKSEPKEPDAVDVDELEEEDLFNAK